MYNMYKIQVRSRYGKTINANNFIYEGNAISIL